MKFNTLLLAIVLLGGSLYAMKDPNNEAQENLELLWQIALPASNAPYLELFKNVCILDLSSRALGELPKEISSMFLLKNLDLSYNNLKELPASVGSLKKLKKLNLRDNWFTKVPPCITNCKNLNTLCLDNNRLTTLPKSITKLQRLRKLHCAGNILIALPPALGKISNLKELDVSCNKLTSLPLSLRYLTNLSQVNLTQNPWGFENKAPSTLMTLYYIAGKSCIRSAYNALLTLKKAKKQPKLRKKLQALYKKATSNTISYASIPVTLATDSKIYEMIKKATSRYTLNASNLQNPTTEALLVLRAHVDFMRWFIHLAYNKTLYNTNPLNTHKVPQDVKKYLWTFTKTPSNKHTGSSSEAKDTSL